MPAELKGRIAVDTSDLNRAGSEVDKFDKKLDQTLNKKGKGTAATVAGDVGASLGRGLQTGSLDAAVTDLAASFGGLGVVAGAAIGIVGAGFVKGISSAREFISVLDDTEKTLERVAVTGGSLSDLSKNLEDITKAQEKISNVSFLGKVFTTPVFGEASRQYQREQLSNQFAKTLDAQVDKSRQLAEITLLEAGGHKAVAAAMKERISISERLAEIEATAISLRQKVADSPQLAPKQEAQELAAIDAWEAHQKAITRGVGDREAMLKRVAPLLERAQLSGKEIQGGAGTLADRLQMRQADIATALGEKFRQQGFVGLAAEQFLVAERFKANIGGLKESEKTPELALRSAIDGATVFQGMLQTLVQISNGVNNISFTNK